MLGGGCAEETCVSAHETIHRGCQKLLQLGRRIALYFGHRGEAKWVCRVYVASRASRRSIRSELGERGEDAVAAQCDTGNNETGT